MRCKLLTNLTVVMLFFSISMLVNSSAFADEDTEQMAALSVATTTGCIKLDQSFKSIASWYLQEGVEFSFIQLGMKSAGYPTALKQRMDEVNKLSEQEMGEICKQIKYAYLSKQILGSEVENLLEIPSPSVVTLLSGLWSDAGQCDDAKTLHRFNVSVDGLRLEQIYDLPFQTPNGRYNKRRYRILYGNSNSVVLYKEGEEFELPTGDRVVRQLIVNEDGTYAWRLYGKPEEWRSAELGKRCAN